MKPTRMSCHPCCQAVAVQLHDDGKVAALHTEPLVDAHLQGRKVTYKVRQSAVMLELPSPLLMAVS